MGHAYFESEGVRGHIHFADYCFRFLWWTCEWQGYCGPGFFIRFPILACNLRWKDRACYKNLSLPELWWEVKHSFWISEYEKNISPGQYHILWWVWNRWYKKHKEELR